MRQLVIFLFSLFLLSSCKHKEQVPKDILPKDKMQEVLWSMISAGEFLNGYVLTKDSVDKVAASAKVYGQVFQIHHISKEEFEKSYSYYKQRPELMKIILDSLVKKETHAPGTSQRREDSMRGRIRTDSVIK